MQTSEGAARPEGAAAAAPFDPFQIGKQNSFG